MDTNLRSALEMVMLEKSPRECRRAIRVVAFDRQCVCWRNRQKQRGHGRGRADPSEPASTGSPQIEHPEMQTGVRLDAHSTLLGHGVGATQAGLLTSLPATTAA